MGCTIWPPAGRKGAEMVHAEAHELTRTDDPEIAPDRLHFLALGGSGEFGVNLNLYAYAGKWLIVDLGIGFGDDSTPGVDILLPDAAFIAARADDLVAIVVTHGHEDHIGAVAHLWPELGCPVYATPFTAALLRRKFAEAGLKNVPLHVIPMGATLELDPFAIELVTVTHSIPEPNLVVIRTPAGNIVHTGDWKLDPDPVIGSTTDIQALRRVGEEGVLAMIGDSTGAMVPGNSSSEADLQRSLTEIMAAQKGRIAVTCFSSNVARLTSIARAAEDNGRHVALVGRSLHRIDECARETGFMADVKPFLDAADAAWLPRERVVYICTGSQGEPRSALARIAENRHAHVLLERGDCVIYSARAIPGNEKPIIRMQNLLMNRGVDIVTSDDAFVHVSGHPARQEMTTMYQWVRPRIAIPVHGERHHLEEHAKLARSCQVPHVIVPDNGDLICLDPDAPACVARVPAGVLGLDGGRPIAMDGNIMRFRRKVLIDGHAVVTLVLDPKGRTLAPPRIAAPALIDSESETDLMQAARKAVAMALDKLPGPQLRDDEAVRQAAFTALRRFFRERQGKKPAIDIHLIRV